MIIKEPCLTLVFLLAAVGPFQPRLVSAEVQSEKGEGDFEQHVAKTFITKCLKCHNSSEPNGELDLTSIESAQRGGDSGPAIVPGNVDSSTLVTRIRDGEMPPADEGPPVSKEELNQLEDWIRSGAPWPANRQLSPYEYSTPGHAGLDFWSLQPLERPETPSIRSTKSIQNPIDAFIIHQLDTEGLQLSPAADRVTLIRRLTLDLLGLPPTPKEINTFVNDTDGRAYQELVNRLLDSKHYGERWGRHWLDVVRYADTSGYESNILRPTAWHYRDYVINAFNRDLPYDQFIIEQLAGDAIGAREATGFLVCAAFDNVTFRNRNEMQRMQVRQDELHEFINTTTQTFLGLTVACSRCHDHKFDPITHQDYYALQAVFSGIRHPERTITHYPFREEMKKTRTEEERLQLIAEYEAEIKTLPPAPQSERRMEVRSILLALQAKQQGTHLANWPYAVLRDEPHEPTYRLHRGDVSQRKEIVPPAAISSLSRQLDLNDDTPEQQRRMALAKWIANAKNPLTARVMANRIWQFHFGMGLADTPSNFGGQGTLPTHPELLDWLASEFIDQGWSVKAMHRMIVSSNTYQQSATPNDAAFAVDADNRLLWRFPSHRLAAEAIRDSILHVSGKLNTAMGGLGYKTYHKGSYRTYKPVEDFGDEHFRRMVYEFRVRIEADPTFGVLDCADGGQLCPQRTRSTTPIQALNLFNSKFVVGQSNHFASRVAKLAGEDDLAGQVREAFRLAYGRIPGDEQLADCVAVVGEHGLATLCRAIFNSNEFLFLP